MQAGLPPGVLNIVTGFGEAGAALAAHPDIDKVAFTGSTEVGKEIVKAAAGNLKKVTLELGGKSPNVVYADADIEKAIAGSAHAIFFNQGECCVAGSRLYVEESVYDQVVEGVAERHATSRSATGSTDHPDGPARLVGAVRPGHRLHQLRQGRGRQHPRRRPGGRQGLLRGPTVLTGTREEMKAVQEEIFGPVVAAAPFNSDKDILPTANNTNYGLGAGVFTRDASGLPPTADRAHRARVHGPVRGHQARHGRRRQRGDPLGRRRPGHADPPRPRVERPRGRGLHGRVLPER